MADNYILHGYPTGQSVETALDKGRDSVTESEVTSRLALKQDKLSSRQLQAVDSGITADTYTTIVSDIQIVESKVIANIPAGQDLKYASNITIEMNPNTYEITVQLWDQKGAKLGNAVKIDLPLESVVVSGYYDEVHKQLVLVLKNEQTITIPVSSLISGLQPLISVNNKLNADLVDDTYSSNKFMNSTQYQRLLQSVNKVKMDGVANVSGLTIEDGTDHDRIITHTNLVNAVDSPAFKKVAYDTHGHVTQSANVSKSDITDLGLSGSDIDLADYQKASTVRAITADDNVNTAIGILEKAVENGGQGTGTVKSVAIAVPQGMYTTGSPITTEGTITIALQSGYILPTTTQMNSKVSVKIDETDDELLILY